MKGFLRHLCPSYIGLGYGNWCGAKRTADGWHDEPAIDDGDAACRLHDFGLRVASTPEAIKANDEMLYYRWRDFEPKTIYGKIYRKALLIAFKPRRKK